MPIDKEKAMTLYQQGFGDPEIARRTGTSTTVVYKWRHSEGLPSQLQIQQKQADELWFPLYEQGLSDWKIAKITGKKRETVRDWRERHHLPSNASHRQAEDRKKSAYDVPAVPEDATERAKACGMSYGAYTAYMRTVADPDMEYIRLKRLRESSEAARREYHKAQAEWWKHYKPVSFG